MEKIKAKPIEIFKNIIIAILTVSMLLLAGLYIGGSQFTSNKGAINTLTLPNGTVTVGTDAPMRSALYEKDLLAVSFAAISCSGGGGTYGNEAAARDLLSFASAPIHTLTEFGAKISKSDAAAFENAVSKSKYIYISLANPLPYQIIYALTGPYSAAAGSDCAITVDTMLLSFTADGNAALYLKDGENYYLSTGDCRINLSEALAMANDSRLSSYEINSQAIALSLASPHTQTLSLAGGKAPSGKQYAALLSLFGYDAESAANESVVAPHGTVSFADAGARYTASKDSGLAISQFLDSSVDTLDISFYDVLLASVSLVEKIKQSYPEMTGAGLDTHLSEFYHEDGVYTVVFGLSDSSVMLSGKAFPYLASLTVSGGRFKSIDVNFIGAVRSGKTSSPFPSAFEYSYAEKKSKISSFTLCYAVDTLPVGELDARWYFTEGGAK